MTTPTPEEPTALEDLKEIRRTLQDAGITLLQAATAAVSAAAKLQPSSASSSVVTLRAAFRMSLALLGKAMASSCVATFC